jgi:hypothetical protein
MDRGASRLGHDASASLRGFKHSRDDTEGLFHIRTEQGVACFVFGEIPSICNRRVSILACKHNQIGYAVMSLSDLVQVLSLIFLAGALLVSAGQGRQMLLQSTAMAGELFNDVSTSLMQAHTDQRTTFFLSDPELLAWHLASRDIGVLRPSRTSKGCML